MEKDNVLGSLMKQSPKRIRFGLAAEKDVNVQNHIQIICSSRVKQGYSTHG
jgi:hypothetical protein